MSVLIVAVLAVPGLGAPATATSAPAVTATHGEAVTAAKPAALPQTADEVGRWRVRPHGTEWVLTWTSPTRLPVTDARPEFLQDDVVLGAPQISADQRTLRLVVEGEIPPAASDLDVVLSGRLLDEPESSAPQSAAPAYSAPADQSTLADDPGTPGTHPVVTDDYRLAPVKLPGMPAKVEMLGHVVRQEDATASSPLVLFLHGRHNPCYGRPTGSVDREWPCPTGMQPVPSHLGYRYIQQRLATQGYVTVSISANGINAQDWRLDDGGAAARALLIRAHLAHWANSTSPRFLADLDSVVLVGHSRGGEGSNRAALTIPLTAPYRIVGQVLIGPTDFGRQTTPYVHTVTVLPYCDGDVADLQGQIYTDAARDVVADDDQALHSSVLMMGTNHNYFNIEWTPPVAVAPAWDDWGGDPDDTCGTATEERLTAREQRKVGRTYVAGAVHLMASGDQSVLPMFDGSQVAVPSAGDADVRTHLVASGRDLRRIGMDAGLGASSANTDAQMCVGRTGTRSDERACGRGVDSFQAPHWTPEFPPGIPAVRNVEMAWTTPGAWARMRLHQPLDLSAASSLDLRTIVDTRLGNVRLHVVLRDEFDNTVELTPELDGRLPALPQGDFSLGKRWAQTLRVPLTGAGSVDLSRIVAVTLRGESTDGRVWVLDLAAARSDLPATPAKRAARVSLGRVEVLERDGPDDTIARIPYTVAGALPAEAEVVVVPLDWWDFESVRPIRQRITAQTGYVRVPVEADQRDDRNRRPVAVYAYPRRGIMTGDYIGRLTILDDDPTPTIELVTPKRRVTEGNAAIWRVRLSEPTDYGVLVRARFVEGRHRETPLRVEDVRRHWIKIFFGDPPPSRPLHKLDQDLLGYIEPGDRAASFEVPLRRDRTKEGREVATLRITALRHSLRAAVYAVDP
ncbi:MAG: hypothetical protein ACRDO2_01200 [Nocardioidaceae bacterium]